MGACACVSECAHARSAHRDVFPHGAWCGGAGRRGRWARFFATTVASVGVLVPYLFFNTFMYGPCDATPNSELSIDAVFAERGVGSAFGFDSTATVSTQYGRCVAHVACCACARDVVCPRLLSKRRCTLATDAWLRSVRRVRISRIASRTPQQGAGNGKKENLLASFTTKKSAGRFSIS